MGDAKLKGVTVSNIIRFIHIFKVAKSGAQKPNVFI
jgi:hypothetical protein